MIESTSDFIRQLNTTISTLPPEQVDLAAAIISDANLAMRRVQTQSERLMDSVSEAQVLAAVRSIRSASEWSPIAPEDAKPEYRPTLEAFRNASKILLEQVESMAAELTEPRPEKTVA